VAARGGALATDFDALAECPGTTVKRHRTGDVALVAAADAPFGVALYRKRFWYPTRSDRLRGVLRTTWLAPSRVEREAKNLERLAAWELQPALFLAYGERRRRRFLLDSFLCTRALEARPIDELLRQERDATRREALLESLARFVARLHARGFVDRDLHLRNFLATSGNEIAKIDSPFGAVVARWRRAAAQRRERDELELELAAATNEAERSRFARAFAAATAAS
jgi:tRNA A-37 threonylcarbamoyl transferase component Bud32